MSDDAMQGVYEQMRELAAGFFRGQPPDHTLQPTALVHEAYLRLTRNPGLPKMGRSELLRLAAGAMRSVLVDHARRRGALKRGAGYVRVSLDDVVELYQESVPDLVALDEALEKLDRMDGRLRSVIELRFFGGLSRVGQVVDLPSLSRCRTFDIPSTRRRMVKAGQRPAPPG